jgi:hypothetical protein
MNNKFTLMHGMEHNVSVKEIPLPNIMKSLQKKSSVKLGDGRGHDMYISSLRKPNY